MAAPVQPTQVALNCPRRPLKKTTLLSWLHIYYIATMEGCKRIKSSQTEASMPYRVWAIPPAGTLLSLCSHGVSFVQKRCWYENSSDFRTFHNQTARGDAREPWAALRAAPTSRNWEPVYQIARTHFIKNS